VNTSPDTPRNWFQHLEELHMSNPGLLAMLFLLMISGCGGEPNPRNNFIGNWTATRTATLDFGPDGMSTSPGTLTFAISPGKGDDEVTWSSSQCTFTGVVTTDSSLAVNPVVCPPANSTSCLQLVFSVKAGTGSLNGTTLNLNYGGDISGVCSGKQVKGTFGYVISAAKN